MSKFLIIEGTTDTSNGDLRAAFSRLFEQLLKGRMPRIIMGNSKNQAIDKFQNQRAATQKSLLIDLDADNGQRNTSLQAHRLTDETDGVFFMIQEMEAWFLSQPDVLEQYYNAEFASRIRCPAHTIPNPCEELQRLTRDTKKRTYHKVKHAVELLPKLNLATLCNSFDDVEKLIDRLSQ